MSGPRRGLTPKKFAMKAALIALSLCAPAGAYYAGRPPVALRRTSIARPALLDANGLPIAPTVKTVPGAENQDHEITLGELIFSSRDPRLDVRRGVYPTSLRSQTS